jgi:hypothetical protein
VDKKLAYKFVIICKTAVCENSGIVKKWLKHRTTENTQICDFIEYFALLVA